MTNMEVVLTIPQVSPLDDPVSVSLHYRDLGGTPAGSANTLALIGSNLFNTVGAGASLPMSSYLGSQADRGTNHCVTNVYDVTAHLDGTPHGSPVATMLWTLGASIGAPNLPESVAACVSYRADYGTDVEFGAPTGVETGRTRPRAQDRGRLYFGPLVQGVAISEVPTGRVHFTTQFITDCLANVKQMLIVNGGDSEFGNQWGLSTWSRKGAVMKGITEFWMDDRPDTQRRRADPSGLKTFLTV
jgi:hypothetical protein